MPNNRAVSTHDSDTAGGHLPGRAWAERSHDVEPSSTLLRVRTMWERGPDPRCCGSQGLRNDVFKKLPRQLSWVGWDELSPLTFVTRSSVKVLWGPPQVLKGKRGSLERLEAGGDGTGRKPIWTAGRRRAGHSLSLLSL